MTAFFIVGIVVIDLFTLSEALPVFRPLFHPQACIDKVGPKSSVYIPK